MAFYSLPLKRHNVKIPEEYCYLVICKHTENSFKPQKGKRLSAEESKRKKESLSEQEQTLKQLDIGYFNLYNNKIKLDTIFDSSFTSYLEDSNRLIYKIKPLASHESTVGYSSRKIYEVSEFDVVRKLQNKEEVINQIYKDGLLREFSAIMFNNYSYGNEEYNLKLHEYFEYIKKTFIGFEISLSDIMLTDDYNHYIREKFNRKDTYEITRTNIRYLLDNGLIKYVKEEDYYMDRLIIGLIECGLYDVALNCVKLLNEYNIKSLLRNKDFEMALRKWSTDKDVKEIINFLNIKLNGITLIIRNSYDIVETKNFDNIGEVKTYLIKNYNVPFEEILKKDVSDLEIWDEDEEKGYRFEIK